MRPLALVFLLTASSTAFSANAERPVARVFGRPVTATELNLKDPAALPEAARQLRERVLQEALRRFVAERGLQATEADFAAFEKWEKEFRRVDGERRKRELVRIDNELKSPGLEPRKRAELEQYRDNLKKTEQFEAERAKDPALQTPDRRAAAWWIEGYKARKGLYEKYGGTVGITKFGPDPVGAISALFREHEKKKELVILDAALAREFWSVVERPPRFPAKPGEIDFSYYWLKPVPAE